MKGWFLTMKKLTATFLSLMMCFSLMAIPAQAGFIPTPDPDGPGIVDVGGKKDPADPGDDGADAPQYGRFPDPIDDSPIDD